MSMIDAMMDASRIPTVRADYIRYIAGHGDFDEFLRSGAEVFVMLELAALRHGGKMIENFDRVLDFGCGSGRLLRFLIPRAEKTVCKVFGCDVSEPLVSFLHESFPTASVHKNSFNPPLYYPDNYFNLIFSFSVFSHLSKQTENLWLEELNRIGDNGCLYLITVHGEWFIKNVYRNMNWDPGPVYENGFEFRKSMQPREVANDFPEGYEISFHTYDYIMREWQTTFDIVDVLRGDEPSRYLWGNHYFEPHGTVPAFRSMGQDLVILRKR